MSVINRVGHKYGRLTVIERADNDKQAHAKWLCACDCGKASITLGHSLASGAARSCGCLRDETSRRHGASGTPEYNSYRAARRRCETPGSDDFPNYGGRGIKFLYTSFQEFVADVGPRPDGMSIDRIDNSGHYEIGNCKWSTPVEQQNNRRTNWRVTAFGKTQTVTQWAMEYGVKPCTMWHRLNRGVPLEQAVRL